MCWGARKIKVEHFHSLGQMQTSFTGLKTEHFFVINASTAERMRRKEYFSSIKSLNSDERFIRGWYGVRIHCIWLLQRSNLFVLLLLRQRLTRSLVHYPKSSWYSILGDHAFDWKASNNNPYKECIHEFSIKELESIHVNLDHKT